MPIGINHVVTPIVTIRSCPTDEVAKTRHLFCFTMAKTVSLLGLSTSQKSSIPSGGFTCGAGGSVVHARAMAWFFFGHTVEVH
jgi:hypothetical protein